MVTNFAFGASIFLYILFLPLLTGPVPAIACTTPTPTSYYAVGDSLAKGLINVGMPGTAIEGIGAPAVLSLIQGIPASALKGQTAVLSSGASNSPDVNTVKQYVPQQIKALQAAGAKVILLGVGSKFSATPINATLQTIATQNGLTFTYIGQTPTDGVHPSPCGLLGVVAGTGSSQANTYALQSLAQNAIQNANPGTVAGQQQLTQALTNFGVSSDDAQKVVTADAANGTSNAQDLLKAFSSGDSSQIAQAASTAGITLNQDTIKNISSLTPSQISNNVSSLYTPAQQTTASAISSTFSQSDQAAPPSTRGGQYASMFNQLETQYNLPSGYLASVAKIESGGNPNICASGSSACGMFQYTSGTWAVDSQRYNAAVNGVNAPLDPSLRFDATTEANVTAYTASYYQSTYANTIANATAAGMDPNAALYSLHNLGTSGGQAFMNAYAQNPNQSVAGVVSQSAINGNPGLYGNGSISLAQAQQNMLKLMGGNVNFTAAAQPANVQSPFTVTSGLGGGQTYYTATGQSPFANVSPIYSTPGLGSSSFAPASMQYTQAPAPYATAPVTQPYAGTPVSTQTPVLGGQSSGQSGTPVDQIIAQPKTVSKGSPITVSWSSVGMSTASPCTVLENGSMISSSMNEGFQIVTASTTGTVAFSLSCTAQTTGSIVTGSASVTVQ